MRIGIFVGAQPASPDIEVQLQQVVAAEKDGFESFWMAQTGWVDALTLLALAGQRTDRIEMGTAVVPTYPRHPTMLAQQAITTQAATGGRLSLGIGPSHRSGIEERWGLSFDRPALHTREYVSVLRDLVGAGSVDFAGEMYRVRTEIQRPTTTPLPILITDGTITWMVGPKTLETHIVPRINSAAQAAGRPKARICVGVPIAVTDDSTAAYETAARSFGRYGQLPSYRRMLDIEGVESPAEVAVIGDDTDVERQLRALAGAGATELLPSVFPVGEHAEASVARTRELLRGLIGKI